MEAAIPRRTTCGLAVFAAAHLSLRRWGLPGESDKSRESPLGIQQLVRHGFVEVFRFFPLLVRLKR